MADETFEVNLLRMIAAELWLSNRLHVARDLFERCYLSLSQAERGMVDQTVFAVLGADYALIILSGCEAKKLNT